MNRRAFFKTIGLSALVAPIIGALPRPELDGPYYGYDAGAGDETAVLVEMYRRDGVSVVTRCQPITTHPIVEVESLFVNGRLVEASRITRIPGKSR